MPPLLVASVYLIVEPMIVKLCLPGEFAYTKPPFPPESVEVIVEVEIITDLSLVPEIWKSPPSEEAVFDESVDS